MFSCGRSTCQYPAVCVVREYKMLTFDLQFTYRTLGIVVGVGAPPSRFVLSRSTTSAVTSNILGSCAIDASLRQCETSPGSVMVSFTGFLGGNLTATVNMSNLESGTYSLEGFYTNEADGSERSFSQITQGIYTCSVVCLFFVLFFALMGEDNEVRNWYRITIG